jgi:hypothetical protein
MPLPWGQALGPVLVPDQPLEQVSAQDKVWVMEPVQAPAWAQDQVRAKDLVPDLEKGRVQVQGKRRALSPA